MKVIVSNSYAGVFGLRDGGSVHPKRAGDVPFTLSDDVATRLINNGVLSPAGAQVVTEPKTEKKPPRTDEDDTPDIKAEKPVKKAKK